MWPWEHAALGYVLFSLVVHAVYRISPSNAGALAVLAGTQFPDLVDKPLAWGLNLFPTGFAIAHSLFIAVPLGIAGALLAARRGHPAVGIGVLVGYWSHLLGDVLAPVRSGGQPALGRVLWPVVESEPYATNLGLARGFVYLQDYIADISTAGVTDTLLVSLALSLLAFGLWAVDGFPGVAWVAHRRTGRSDSE